MENISPALLDWFYKNHRILPFRTDPSPYHVWLSEIMLQQTRVSAALPYYERFLAALPDIPALAACEEEKLHKLWEGLGYYSRVRNLQKAARIVCEQYGGQLPADYDALRALPGIGDYTAGAIASISFDIPVPALDEEFDLALIGKKGTWYDHKVSVSNPVPVEESGKTVDDLALADGTYTAELTFAGGSGKAYIQSPCTLTVADGKAVATVVWSSSKYDYMLVDGERYDVLTTEPGSTFEIPVAAFDTELTVIGDTTAMSTPHEIEYTLNFDSATLTAAE